MTKNIYIVSASDRFNYGDLLFPIITINEISKYGQFEFFNVSIVKSDLSSFGALPTISYKRLYEEKDKGLLIFAGGEILNANWSRLISFIYPWFYFLYERVENKIALEKIVIFLLRCKNNPMPFIPTDPYIFKKFDIIYHGIGGSGIKRHRRNPLVHKTFQSALSFSARDRSTLEDLIEYYGIDDMRLVPDPALLMSDHYTFDKTIDENYIAFQVGHYKNGGDLNLINNELEKLNKHSGLDIHFIPLGNCPGHDDFKSLLWLYENAKYPCKYINPINIETIMKTIANSNIFIGTSLHGIITAMSFDIPFLALNNKIKKIKNYLDTWSPQPMNKVYWFDEICHNTLTILENNYCCKKEIDNQKEIVRESFKKIHKLICNNI